MNRTSIGSIGGRLDYRALAEFNKPADPEQVAAEIRRLHHEQQLSPRDIASALRLDLGAVLNALTNATQESH